MASKKAKKNMVITKKVDFGTTGVRLPVAENSTVQIPDSVKKSFHSRAAKWVEQVKKEQNALKARGKPLDLVKRRDAVFTRMAKKLDLYEDVLELSKIEHQHANEYAKVAKKAHPKKR